MLKRAFVIAGTTLAMGLLAFNLATAEDTAAPRGQTDQTAVTAVSGVSFADSSGGLAGIARSLRTTLTFRDVAPTRAAQIGADASDLAQIGPSHDRRRYEVAVGAAEVGGLPVDVSLAQRTTLSISPDGDIGRTGQGAEVRVGRRLSRLVGDWETATWDKPSWYLFAASDDEAISWTPGGGAGGGSIRYQEDRVEIGDMQIGVGVEAMGAQASLSYVQRDIQGRYGSAEENFTGVTLTWRR
jgi:hypothetical protein